MIKATCSTLYRDGAGKILACNLYNGSQHIQVEAGKLKQLLTQRKIEVENLKLSSDGRLIRKYDPVSDEIQKKASILCRQMIESNGAVKNMFSRSLDTVFCVADPIDMILDGFENRFDWHPSVLCALDNLGIHDYSALLFDNKYFRLTYEITNMVNSLINEGKKKGKQYYIIGEIYLNGTKKPLFVSNNADAITGLMKDLSDDEDILECYVEELKSKIYIPELCS